MAYKDEEKQKQYQREYYQRYKHNDSPQYERHKATARQHYYARRYQFQLECYTRLIRAIRASDGILRQPDDTIAHELMAQFGEEFIFTRPRRREGGEE